VTIERTAYGIPHITAPDAQSLAYGVAYAYAQDNVCMTADQLVTARAQRSATSAPRPPGCWVGATCPTSRSTCSSPRTWTTPLERAWRQTSAETQALARGYVAGYNRYLADHGANCPRPAGASPGCSP
jgi:acyl-homoserine-lactone acylase